MKMKRRSVKVALLTPRGVEGMGQPGYGTKYDFLVDGTVVRVFREGKLLEDIEFSTRDRDTREAENPLHKFLESIGRSRVDAHMVAVELENGKSVSSVF